MEIQVLKYGLENEKLHTTGEMHSLKEFRGIAKTGLSDPTVCVLAPKCFNFLIQSSKDIIEDRGDKEARVDLARYLLARKKIPALFVSSENGGYTSVPRILNGIEKLLARAKAQSDITGSNIYLIGVSETHFKSLSQSDDGLFQNNQNFIGRMNDDASDVSSADTSERFVDLLSNVKVPVELEKAYVGDAECVQLVRKLIMRVAHSTDPVLILGDTGTGKEIVAEYINRQSGRPDKKFRRVNCAAISSDLFDPEVFGIQPKTATGVEGRIGLWEQASGGTLFLDEIADLHLEKQAKILRAIQEKKIRRVGGAEEIPVDTRIIAATNKNLFSLIQQGLFREDLYYRLRVLLIATPALREHPEDIPALANHLWNRITAGKGQTLSAEIISELCRYTWPGNVRELYMVLSGLYSYFYDSPCIELKHLRGVFAHQKQVVGQAVDETEAVRFEKERLELLKYLFKVYDIVKIAQITVQPILSAKSGINEKRLLTADSRLNLHLDELDRQLQLESHMLPRPVYDCISKLQSTLLYFSRVLKKDVKSAVNDLRENMPTDFEAACTIIDSEICRLKESTCPAVS